MEKSYRDLYARLSAQEPANPALTALLAAVGTIDDISPLRVPALIAMKRAQVPPLNLGYRYENGELALFARNTTRKNKNYPLALCGKIEAPLWLFDSAAPFPGSNDSGRAAYTELVRRSFGYLEERIALYFPLGHDSRLIEGPSPSALTIAS